MINQLSLKDISFPILLLSILPFSIILGPTVSLVNIVLIVLQNGQEDGKIIIG